MASSATAIDYREPSAIRKPFDEPFADIKDAGMIGRYNHVGIPTAGSFPGEIPLPHLKMTVSDHQGNPFGIQWQRYWDEWRLTEHRWS